jgi:hypothetical protein
MPRNRQEYLMIKVRLRSTSPGCCLALLVGYITLMCLASGWTTRTLEFWLSYVRHQPVDVPAWISVSATIIGGAIVIPANLISEIVRLAVQ